MIRRSPTRIELKLEDLGDFDYIQKFEKKKAPNAVAGAVGGISAADAQKFIRQDRIGFRPIRAGVTSGSGSSGNWPLATSGGTAIEVDVVPGNGVMTAEASTSTVEGQERVETSASSTTGQTGGANRSNSNVAEMETSGDDGEAVTPSNITAESNVSVAGVDMSLDESL